MLHHKVVHPVLVPDVVNHADVRVIEVGDGLRLASKPFSYIGAVRDIFKKDFDRNNAVQPGSRVLYTPLPCRLFRSEK
jgi:hypothetical protein